MGLINIYQKLARLCNRLQSIALLAVRLTLAYGFYNPAMRKWADIDAIAIWFKSLGIPLPLLNAYMAATTELLGVVLLSLGLFTRAISIPLIIVMLVAIFTVHLPHGFEAADNGFEIPFYYVIFLFVLLAFGPGRLSLDRWLIEKDEA